MKQNELQVGDILLFTYDKGVVSKMIRLVTRSVYTHAGVYIGNGKVAESLMNGFIFNTRSEEVLKNEDQVHVYRLRRSKLDEKQVKNEAVRLLGRRYGFLDLIEILVKVVTRINIFKGNSKRLICSEAVAVIYSRLGYDLVPDKEFDLTTPADLSQSKKVKRIYFS